MFNIFKRKSNKERLNQQYKILLKEAFELSKVNRAASDEKIAEANLVLEQIEKIKE
jgi:hypothetical protein